MPSSSDYAALHSGLSIQEARRSSKPPLLHADAMIFDAAETKHAVDPDLEAVLRAGGCRTRKQIAGSQLVWRVDRRDNKLVYWALVRIGNREMLRQRVSKSDYHAFNSRHTTDKALVRGLRPSFYMATCTRDGPQKTKTADKELQVPEFQQVSPTQAAVLRRLQANDERIAQKRWWEDVTSDGSSKAARNVLRVLPRDIPMADAPALLKMLQPSSLERALSPQPRVNHDQRLVAGFGPSSPQLFLGFGAQLSAARDAGKGAAAITSKRFTAAKRLAFDPAGLASLDAMPPAQEGLVGI